MKQSWIIAKRELSGFFDSLAAYVLMILFLGFTGFFVWIANSNVFLQNEASLDLFFQIAYISLFFFVPLLTMGMLAQERKSGTIELLLTKAVSDRQVVWGKFLAVMTLVTIALGLTFIYVISLANLGNLDNGAVICGYLGLFFMSMAYAGIGLFTSSITQNQIVAVLLAWTVGVLFQWVFSSLATSTTGVLADVFYTLSVGNHYSSMARGVIDSRDVVFFISLTFLGLLLAELSLSKRKFSN